MIPLTTHPHTVVLCAITKYIHNFIECDKIQSPFWYADIMFFFYDQLDKAGLDHFDEGAGRKFSGLVAIVQISDNTLTKILRARYIGLHQKFQMVNDI